MKKILGVIFLSLLLSENAYAKKYKVDDIVEKQFYINKKFLEEKGLPFPNWL